METRGYDGDARRRACSGCGPHPPRGANWSAWGTVAAIVGAAVGATAIFIVLHRRDSGGPTTPRTTPNAAAPAAPAPAAGAVNVALSEFMVAPSPTTIAAGQTTLNITNDGKVQHELLVFRSNLAPAQYPKENGDINEEGPGIVKVSDGDNLDPGTTQTRTVDLTTLGHLTCSSATCPATSRPACTRW